MKPPSASTLPKIILKPGEENRLLAGHPWIFSNEIARGELNLEPGSLCCVENSLGENLGVGFYHPHSLIAIRVLAKGVDCLPSDFFLIKIKEALQFRQNLFTGERSFRLCFGESDGLPGLILDEYEDYVVGQILSVGIERFWDQIQSVLVDILAPKGIFLRNDNEMRRLEGLSLESRVAYGSIPERVQISEEGVQYIVPLMGGQKTGFYFDQRENRIFLRPYFNKRKVLDLHCYVGAFALNAAKFGAEEVWGVDSSDLAIGFARKNAELNEVSEKTAFQKEDAEEMLEALCAKELPVQPDFILLDPPNLVPAKKVLEKAIGLYVKLNAMALKGLPAGGFLGTSSCAHHVSREMFVNILKQAASKSGREVKILELRGQSKDHPILTAMPETEYLHFALVQVH